MSDSSRPLSLRPLTDQDRAAQIIRLALLDCLRKLARAGLDLHALATVEDAIVDGSGVRLRTVLEVPAGLSFLSQTPPEVTMTGGDKETNPPPAGDRPGAFERIKRAVATLLDDRFRKPSYFAETLELEPKDSRVRRALAALKKDGVAENPRGHGYRRKQ